MSSPPASRRIRVYHFCPWADRLEDAAAFLTRLPSLDLRPRVSDPANADLLRMARLDCDWHGENTRCFATLAHPAIQFLPAQVTGIPGLIDLAQLKRPADEEAWLILDGQNPQKAAGAIGKVLTFFTRAGGRVLFYAFDEASRTMPCFSEIAPHLSVLIHDESPLSESARARLSPTCFITQRSWVANFTPFSTPFQDTPDDRVLFLGSKLGLTPHRQRQLDFLRKKLGDRLVVFADHSVGVGERGALNRFKVSLCPEGRKFSTPAMARAHTDRPFWSGCLGSVPLSENSRAGGRLDELASANLIVRYEHADLDSLWAATQHALALPASERRRIYDHFNQHETIGAVVTAHLAAS